MKIARRESKETHHWLELLAEANTRELPKIQVLQNENIELTKILSSIIVKTQ
jgi:four helix bundle protein